MRAGQRQKEAADHIRGAGMGGVARPGYGGVGACGRAAGSGAWGAGSHRSPAGGVCEGSWTGRGRGGATGRGSWERPAGMGGGQEWIEGVEEVGPSADPVGREHAKWQGFMEVGTRLLTG